MASAQDRWGSQYKSLQKQYSSANSMKFARTMAMKMGQFASGIFCLCAHRGRREKSLVEYNNQLKALLGTQRELLVTLIAQLDNTDDRVRELEKLANEQGKEALKNLNAASVGRQAARGLGVS